MENSYMRNSFMFAGKTPHFIEPSTISEYSPSLALSSLSQHHLDMSFLQTGLDALASWLLNDEYMGSTSPYDDDAGN